MLSAQSIQNVGPDDIAERCHDRSVENEQRGTGVEAAMARAPRNWLYNISL
jgi:hypothetical protein